jgi:hypothetical protein
MVSALPDKDSLCYIQMKARCGFYEGCGVFVAPDRVLTNLHVIEGNQRDLRFFNANGECAGARLESMGGHHFEDSLLDLALIELDSSIGIKTATANVSGMAGIRGTFDFSKGHYNGWLGSLFNHVPDIQPTTISAAPQVFRDRKRGISSCMSKFRSTAYVQPGYSGSPVFHKDGVTVISLATSIDPREQADALEYAQYIKRSFGSAPTEPIFEFSGPTPDDFSRFIATANRSLA